jgi:hypothetical protein
MSSDLEQFKLNVVSYQTVWHPDCAMQQLALKKTKATKKEDRVANGGSTGV